MTNVPTKGDLALELPRALDVTLDTEALLTLEREYADACDQATISRRKSERELGEARKASLELVARTLGLTFWESKSFACGWFLRLDPTLS